NVYRCGRKYLDLWRRGRMGDHRSRIQRFVSHRAMDFRRSELLADRRRRARAGFSYEGRATLMLLLIPQKDRRYHRGLGQDTPDLATLLAESNYNQDSPIPSSYPINVFSPPQIASTISPADIGTPS